MSLFRGKKTVKSFIGIFFIVLIIFISEGCEKKDQPRTYPRVETKSVTEISLKGATFNGEIYSLGSEQVINHGFVWSESNNPSLVGDRIFLGPVENVGTFKAEIVTTLVNGVQYTVKSFAQTVDHVVYGIPVTFKSLGSGTPEINGFEPVSAEWLDTVLIKGKNFSWVRNANLVKLGQTQCLTLESTDTTLLFVVSRDLPEIRSVLSVELSGKKAVYSADTFNLIAPVIKRFFPEEAGWGDTITIMGDKFESSHFHYDIAARFNNTEAKITGRGKNYLSVIVPDELNSRQSRLQLSFNKLNLTISENFLLKAPVIKNTKPLMGTWGTLITLTGKFHPWKERNKITVGGSVVRMVSNCRDSIIIEAPGNLTEHVNQIVNISEPFTVVSPDNFILLPPLIESVTPLSGVSGSEVIIRGNYFCHGGVNTVTVKFGAVEASIYPCTETYIQCTLPMTVNNGPISITVTSGSQSTVYNDVFNVVNPRITNVYPLTATFNDEITIEGENLVNNRNPIGVTFTAISEYQSHKDAEILSASTNRLVIKAPLNLDSIPQRLEVFSIYYILDSYSQHDFILRPPEVISVSPAILASGQNLTISGRYFHPMVTGNEVFWGNYQLPVVSSNPGQIVVSVPESLPQGMNRVSVITGGYKRYASGSYQYR